MAISFTRPDPSSPSAVASASFTTARKGFETAEVREFLRMVAAELARLQERERFLERELRSAQRTTAPATLALDEELVTRMLGEEAARILHTSREAAAQIRMRAEDSAARLLREATDEAQRLREEAEIEAARRRADATADAEAELDMAKQQGRDMVNEARAYRERVLNELARRREIARQQIEQLVHGRDRLLNAFERARLAAVDVMAELTPLGEPNEYVNLSPTTGPVPLMVPNMPRPGTEHEPGDATVPLAASSRVPLVDVTAATSGQAAVADAPALDEPAIEGDVADVVDHIDDHLEDEGPMVVPHDPSVTIFVDDDFDRTDAPDDAPDDQLDDVAPETVVIDEAVQVDAPGVVTDDDRDHATEDHATEDHADEGDATEDDATEDDAADDRVVQLDFVPRDGLDDHDDHDDRAVAPVVALFAGEFVRTVETEAETQAETEAETDTEPVDTAADATTVVPRTSADDLFARLRAARAGAVAERAAQAVSPTTSTDTTSTDTTSTDTTVTEARSGGGDSVFHTTPEAPAAPAAPGDTPFARRNEALTPLILTAARKLKRVLADEQNEVLHALRRKEPVRDLDAMLPPAAEQCDRYGAAIAAELVAAAAAGAVSMGTAPTAAPREVKQARATDPATAALGDEIVLPLRERLARCVGDADGDNQELVSLVRLAYREWKTQRIDEHLDDIARLAYGRGALVGVAPGTPICWMVDPDGPDCPDAEDNALAGAVPAGNAFPTDHACAPAHSGCRCMIAPAP